MASAWTGVAMTVTVSAVPIMGRTGCEVVCSSDHTRPNLSPNAPAMASALERASCAACAQRLGARRPFVLQHELHPLNLVRATPGRGVDRFANPRQIVAGDLHGVGSGVPLDAGFSRAP